MNIANFVLRLIDLGEIGPVKRISSLKCWHLRLFSQPREDRVIYRTIVEARPSSVLEVGLGNLQRSEMIIRVMQRFCSVDETRFTAIDLFEASTSHRSILTLREAHTRFARLGTKTRLIPGDPVATLVRMANQIGPHDLAIVTADSQQQLAECWYYMPRVLSEDGLLLVRLLSESTAYSLYSVDEVRNLSENNRRGPKHAA